MQQDSDEGDDDDDDDDDLISPVHKRRKVSDGNEGSPIPTKSSPPPRRSNRLGSRSSPLPTFEDMGTFATPARSSPLAKRSTRLRRKQPSSPAARISRSPSVQTVVSVEIPSPSPRRCSQLSDLGSAETSDEDDKILATQPAPRRRQSRGVKDPFIVNNGGPQYVSDDETPRAWAPRKRKGARDDFVVNDEDVEYISSDEDEAAPQVQPIEKSDRHSSARKAKGASRRRRREEEQDELDDDLQNLQDSDDEPSATKTRTRGGPVTTKRDQAKEHLELLRRRRAGRRCLVSLIPTMNKTCRRRSLV